MAQSQAVTVRLQSVGPIGFLRTVTPLSLLALRRLIVEQLADRIPPTGFSFLVGGVTIATVQEASEDYQEGDVFIVSHAASGPSVAGLPTRPPALSLVNQFADAFGFMCAACAQPLPHLR
mgnify:CR=1 FL=1